MTQEEFDAKHRVVSDLIDAFEADGGCGHDVGMGVLAIIQRWEKIRTPEAVRDVAGVVIGE